MQRNSWSLCSLAIWVNLCGQGDKASWSLKFKTVFGLSDDLFTGTQVPIDTAAVVHIIIMQYYLQNS